MVITRLPRPGVLQELLKRSGTSGAGAAMGTSGTLVISGISGDASASERHGTW
eukprot:CAMPEP_0204350064 /NCGR_PEP_ID=MMETSP0469-20131031/30029_1 /ASSEMBLY_ACC=CAM_ASM_000384 /TAXON_ID=2969 /ORGANISM="Oxyrrhis marina" /LENGTH=52 /DNA_ID=CAMNT_0051336353 /DNA_START=589 /DNA_END=744 /DNA_ORIENTATION=+